MASPDHTGESLALEVTWSGDGDLSRSWLDDFFTNRRLSGGHDLKNIDMWKQDHRAVLTFGHPSAIKDILEKQATQPFNWKGIQISVSRMASPVIFERKEPRLLMLSGAGPVTRHDLESFFSDRIHHNNTILNVSYGYRNNRILIEFAEHPDYEALREISSLMPLKGHMVTLRQVPLPTMIQVTAEVLPGYDELELHFSHEKNGCTSDSFTLTMHPDLGCAVIDYANHEAVLNLLQRQHIVSGHLLHVIKFYPSFGVIPFGYNPLECPKEESDLNSEQEDVIDKTMTDKYWKKVLMPQPGFLQFISSTEDGKAIIEEIMKRHAVHLQLKENNCTDPNINNCILLGKTESDVEAAVEVLKRYQEQKKLRFVFGDAFQNVITPMPPHLGDRILELRSKYQVVITFHDKGITVEGYPPLFMELIVKVTRLLSEQYHEQIIARRTGSERAEGVGPTHAHDVSSTTRLQHALDINGETYDEVSPEAFGSSNGNNSPLLSSREDLDLRSSESSQTTMSMSPKMPITKSAYS